MKLQHRFDSVVEQSNDATLVFSFMLSKTFKAGLLYVHLMLTYVSLM